MRHRKTDAHIATIRVSVPIAAMDAASVSAAAEAIGRIQGHLPLGSTVEVLNSRFGRVDAAITPKQVLDLLTPREPQPEPEKYGAYQGAGLGSMPAMNIQGAMADINAQLRNQPDEIPDSLRRVLRPAPNGGTPMDPSGDGSFRGPDGAA